MSIETALMFATAHGGEHAVTMVRVLVTCGAIAPYPTPLVNLVTRCLVEEVMIWILHISRTTIQDPAGTRTVHQRRPKLDSTPPIEGVTR